MSKEKSPAGVSDSIDAVREYIISGTPIPDEIFLAFSQNPLGGLYAISSDGLMISKGQADMAARFSKLCKFAVRRTSTQDYEAVPSNIDPALGAFVAARTVGRNEGGSNE